MNNTIDQIIDSYKQKMDKVLKGKKDDGGLQYNNLKKYSGRYYDSNELTDLHPISKNIDKNIIINENDSLRIVPSYRAVAKVVFDFNSKNFHIFPADREERKKLSRDFARIRDNICLKLSKITKPLDFSKQINVNKNFVLDTKFYDTLTEHCKGEIGGSGSEGNILAFKDEDGNGLYKFIEIRLENISYTINFMRYVCDLNGVVGCTMRAIQFHKDTGKINLGGICYPQTNKDFDFNANSNQHVCYNPPVTWPKFNEETGNYNQDDITNIIDWFIYFIEKKGKKEDMTLDKYKKWKMQQVKRIF